MANKKKASMKKNGGRKKFPSNSFVAKALTFVGIAFLFMSLLYLINYFFVKKSNLTINISTDKKVEYLTIKKEETLIVTQKYVSDLDYSMRYDINSFKVFKYKDKDIFSFLRDCKIVLSIEKSTMPKNCAKTTFDNEYSSCYVKVDSFTQEYYFSKDKKVYKIVIKLSEDNKNKEVATTEINYMLNSFNIVI